VMFSVRLDFQRLEYAHLTQGTMSGSLLNWLLEWVQIRIAQQLVEGCRMASSPRRSPRQGLAAIRASSFKGTSAVSNASLTSARAELDEQLGHVGSPKELNDGTQDRFARRMDRGAKGASC
jgi:hypothetical protein